MLVLHYTSRTHDDKDGEHAFFGLTGLNASAMATYFAVAKNGPQTSSDTKNPVTISPYLNQTTILTDEVMAAATAAAFDFQADSGEVMTFDCSEMLAPDGRTYADWMGEKAQTAIKIKAFNPKKEVLPLKDIFSIELSEDWGVLSSSVSTATSASTASNAGANAHMGGLTNAEINSGMMFDAGYIPKTLLHITTRHRGYNANTATPVIIDYNNNPISTSEWKKHLRGEYFTSHPGDHITPLLHNMPIKLSEETTQPILYAESAGTVSPLWESGKQYKTVTVSGSGSGARHSVLFDWRGPRLIDSMGSAGSGYEIGDTYRVFDYEYVIGVGTIDKYAFYNPITASGYATSTTYSLVGGLGSGAECTFSGVTGGRPNGNSITITNAGTGYANGDILFATGGSASDNVHIILEAVNAGLGSNYSASTTYNLQVGGVTKAQAQFEVDGGVLTKIITPLVDVGTYGYNVSQDFDVVDPAGTGSGGKVQISQAANSLFTVRVIEGITRHEDKSYRWGANGDFLLGPYGREKAYQINHLDATDSLFTAASGFRREFNWVTPTKLYVTEADSMLVYPVGDKIRFLGADTTKGIDGRVWRRTIEKSYLYGIASQTKSQV